MSERYEELFYLDCCTSKLELLAFSPVRPLLSRPPAPEQVRPLSTQQLLGNAYAAALLLHNTKLVLPRLHSDHGMLPHGHCQNIFSRGGSNAT
jgi:hypothetical protein